jgi:hypothetical protein
MKSITEHLRPYERPDGGLRAEVEAAVVQGLTRTMDALNAEAKGERPYKARKGLLNRAATRAFILHTINRLRPHLKITRVSVEALELYETRLRAMIIGDVHRHPSIGRTFRS